MSTTREWKSIKEYSDIKFEFFEGIAKITINRPEVYNGYLPRKTGYPGGNPDGNR
jgi:naphthoate synthase